MNLSALFIKRPVATTLLMIAIMAFGLLAYGKLPVSQLPNVDFPTVLVSASLPGASAETIASSLATPLEREFSTIDGVASMNSTNTLGFTSITIQFDLKKNLDSAALDVQAAIARAGPRLPRDLPAPPSFRKVNPADQPILYLSLASKTLPLYTVHEFGETRLAQTISTVRGVAQVQIYGAQKYAVRVQMDPNRLAGRSIGIDEVANAIRGANVNLPTGIIHGANKAFAIMANGQLTSAAEYAPVVLSYRDGAPVRIEDVGRAIDSVENDKTAAWTGDQRSIVLAIQKQPGANTVAVSDAVKELIPRFRSELPTSLDLDVLFDRAESVRESVEDVQLTLLLTLGLVVLVIFLFLRRLTVTVIPSLAMPLSIFGTFAVMHPLHYSLDNLSLMALTLSVGFVVDDAIVMLENIVRHVEMGKSPYQAALDGSREIGFTILSMTSSLVAVFLPFLFMGGIIGRLFEEFAVTIAVSIVVSGFVSLTLTPMLASRFVRGGHEGPGQPGGRTPGISERVFEAVVAWYSRTLSSVLRHPSWAILFSAVVLAATALMYVRIPKGFLPTEDNDQIFAMTEAVEGVSFDALKERQQQIARIIDANPNVVNFMSSVGSRGGAGGPNNGIVFARLKPKHDREKSADQVIAELSPELSKVPGMRVFAQVPPPVRIGGTLTKSEYQLTLQGTDTQELYRVAPILQDELAKSNVLRDVTTDLLLKNPELDVTIDRDRAASLGLTALQIEDSLYSAFGTRQVSTIYSANNTYQVILELDPRSARDPSALDQLHVRAPGGLVPLRAAATVHPGVGALAVNHAGQLPAVTLSFNVARGHGLSEAVTAAEDAARRVLPGTITTRFQGAAEAFQSSLAGLGLLLVVSIFVIYIVLGILYESFIHPITILSALPFAGFGALVTLMVFKIDLNVYAFVGVILLVGLVKKNGIMMVDFAIEARKEPGVTAAEAIHRACVVRFRPIMMTTLAALFGTLPIALGLGAGAESRRPLGLAVVGGLLFSQMLTLYVTPVFYVILEGFRGWGSGRRSRKHPPEPVTSEALPAPP